MSEIVLDASALLAAVRGEPGAESVILGHGTKRSAVNFSEVVAKLADRGAAERDIRGGLDVLELMVEPFDRETALLAGLLRPEARAAGLSLSDRACLALAQRLGLPVVTADRRWAKLSLPVQVQTIR